MTCQEREIAQEKDNCISLIYSMASQENAVSKLSFEIHNL
jgi:hypothetical protein